MSGAGPPLAGPGTGRAACGERQDTHRQKDSVPSSRSIRQLTMSPAAHACRGRRPDSCAGAQQPAPAAPGAAPPLPPRGHLRPCPPPPVPYSPSELPRGSWQAVEKDVGQVGPGGSALTLP